MKKIFCLTLLLSAFGIQSLAAEPAPSRLTPLRANHYTADLEYNMMHYFYYKNTAQLETIINYLSNSDYLEKYKSSKPFFQGFFIGILHENSAAFYKLYLLMPSKQVRLILSSSKEFSSDMERILSNKQNYYPESPAFLDMLWGYFSSTGDKRVISKICQIKENDHNALIRAAAEWSLKSQLKQYNGKVKGCGQ